MLIVARKENQTIEIGGDVKIHFFKIGESRVLVGIDAPEDITVHRGEVAERIRAAKPPAPRPALDARADE